MRATNPMRGGVIWVGLYLAGACLATPAAVAQSAGEDAAGVTFTRDVAPILQRSCQVCHRPGQMAPMALLTYEETRP